MKYNNLTIICVYYELRLGLQIIKIQHTSQSFDLNYIQTLKAFLGTVKMLKTSKKRKFQNKRYSRKISNKETD